jgi:hypothetical protein
LDKVVKFRKTRPGRFTALAGDFGILPMFELNG